MYPMYQQPQAQYPTAGGPLAPSGSYLPSTQTMPGTMAMPGTAAMPGTTAPSAQGTLPVEESYIENILRLNLGKMATLYMTYENNKEWNAQIVKGRLEAAGRDHIIVSDPTTGMRYLLLMVNLDYITFDEELNYTYPFR
jgi:spore germination protein Q